jgi:DNA-binding CsgD family transcriptional regulator
MTRLLYLPDDDHYALFELPMEDDALIDLITTGGWRPPGMPPAEPGDALSTFHLGRLVVAFPSSRSLDLMADAARLALSARQHLALRSLAEGLTNRQIALRMNISASMVKHHLGSLRRHFGVSTRSQLVAHAVRLGFVDP